MGAQPAARVGNLSLRPTEASLFWIELAFMVVISIRFARGASKLRSYMDSKTPEKDWKDGEEWQAKTE